MTHQQRLNQSFGPSLLKTVNYDPSSLRYLFGNTEHMSSFSETASELNNVLFVGFGDLRNAWATASDALLVQHSRATLRTGTMVWSTSSADSLMDYLHLALGADVQLLPTLLCLRLVNVPIYTSVDTLEYWWWY
jgi:hypothetical protein